jgi:hypothetical protein
MIKSIGRGGTASVTFTLDEAVGADHAAICGEWNNWSPDQDIMERVEGCFRRTVELEAGRTYRFRYLLDGHRWENDWAADWYEPNGHGQDDSMLDLSTPPPETSEATAGASAAADAKATTSKARKAAPKAGTGKNGTPKTPSSKKAASKQTASARRATRKAGE